MHLVRRRALALLMVATWLVLGTACAKFDGEVTVHPDDTVSVRFDASVPDTDQAAAARLKELCRPKVQPKPEPYAAKGRVGCRITGQLNQRKQPNAGILVLTADGRQKFMFSPQLAASADAGDLMGRLGEFSEFHLRVTFRGKVLTHNGGSTVTGRTVTWTDSAALGQRLEAEAAQPGLFDRSVGEWVAIGAALAALLGFIGWTLGGVFTRQAIEHRQPWGGPAYGKAKKPDRVA